MTPEEQILYFANNYEMIANYHLVDNTKKVKLGDNTTRICKYCGKSEPEVNFRSVSHAIPEFIGNKSLTDYDECDQCNDFFSMAIEDHFAKYLGALRTVAQLKGKKGVPTYVAKDGKSRISLEQAGMKMTSYEQDPLVDLDLENNKMLIKAYRKPYVPMGAFKCIVKMALAIMPKQDLTECQHLVKWIREDKHSFESFPYKPLNALLQFTPGPAPYKGVHLFLLKRKNTSEPIPYIHFIVAFGNTLFQIILPMPTQDKHLMGKSMSVTFFPVPFDKDYEYGQTTRRDIDFTSPDIVRDEYQPLSMVFERAEVVEVTQPSGTM